MNDAARIEACPSCGIGDVCGQHVRACEAQRERLRLETWLWRRGTGEALPKVTTAWQERAQSRPAENGDAGSHRQNRREDPATVRWVGSKGAEGVWQRIISEMPPHGHYVEAFVGTGVIAARKRPATRTTLIDRDERAPGLALATVLPQGAAIVGDALHHLRSWRGSLAPSDLVYCDPPYLGEVRSCDRDYYRHEMKGEGEHVDLLWLLKMLPCNVILSGYWSQVYAQVLEGWRTVQIPTVNRAGTPVTEWLWCNFPVPTELHDWRFYGEDFRERERIARKRKRIVGKVLRLPPIERAAALAEIGEALRKGKKP